MARHGPVAIVSQKVQPVDQTQHGTARAWAGMARAGQARHGPPCQPSMAHKGLGRANGRGEGNDENPTMEEVQGGQRQISEDGGEETMMEKRLWPWILEQWRTEAGKGGGGEKKRSDERLEDDGLGKKQGNGGDEEEAGDGAAVATMKQRTETWAERGWWIR